MKHFLTLIIALAITVTTNAQTIDTDRMHRDLEVAENALGTIIESAVAEFPGWHIRDKDIEADYVKDYGVVFTVNSKSIGYVVLGENAKGKNKNKNKNKDKKKAKDKAHADAVVVDVHEEAEKKKHEFIENCKTFLADYAGIIGQLDDNEMISIRRNGSDSHVGSLNLENVYFEGQQGVATTRSIYNVGDLEKMDSELNIEVSVGKINKLRRGDITREQFFDAVKVIENVRSYEKDADLETLSAMFHRVYKKDLSKTYYSERKPKYSKLSNFGVVVKMKFYSSYENNNEYSMPTINKKGLTLEERNNYVMELLPQFEAEFRENLVNYGRTMRDLDNDDIIMFEINMTTCKGCKDFPRTMKFSVKKSVLQKFNRGELTLKQAAEKVNVDRIAK